MRKYSKDLAAGFLAGLMLVPLAHAQSPTEAPAEAPAKSRPKAARIADIKYTPKPKGTLTFTEHIAPIVFNNCASCHRPGEAAPFALLTYADVKKRARLIAEVTGETFMPPWHAEPGYCEFANERRISDEQIGMLRQWYAEGAIEGDAAKLPALPKFPEGWQLGKPDLVVKMSEAYTVRAEGQDIYRYFAVPLNLTEDKWVKAIEFRPSARTVVHHCLFFLDTTGTARKLDEADPEPGYNGGGGGRGRGLQMSGGLGGWAVGGNPRPLPEGLAWHIPKGADLVLQTHFHPSGKVEQEQSVIGFYFADGPPKKTFAGIQLPPIFGAIAGIDIPAGEKHYVIKDSFVLPVDVEAFAVNGHAHQLAKEMKMIATMPDGHEKWLMKIGDWDFAWQEQYTYKQPFTLPKGTRIDSEISYDNSADNPKNPTIPPVRVRWGRMSSDEMGSVTLQVVAAKEEEMPQLRASLKRHMADSFIDRAMAESKKETGRGGFVAGIIKRFDKDGDGKLSDEERAQAREFIQQQRELAEE
ncbi:MAG: cytochrome c [Verrucomicrobia bacterium]|nr:cytochrome c [Verrucomicrobiota bacterium]